MKDLEDYFADVGVLGGIKSSFGNVVDRLRLGVPIQSSGAPERIEDDAIRILDARRSSRDVYRRLVAAGPTVSYVLEQVHGPDVLSLCPHASTRYGRLVRLAVVADGKGVRSLESACMRAAIRAGSTLRDDDRRCERAREAAEAAYGAALAAYHGTRVAA